MAGEYVFLTYSYNIGDATFGWKCRRCIAAGLAAADKRRSLFLRIRKKSVFLQQIKPEAWK